MRSRRTAVTAIVAAATVGALSAWLVWPSAPTLATVTIAGELFHLEVADDERTQDRGLAGRTLIETDGGMIFVFPAPEWQQFVMRDCLIPLDLLYLDEAGRILSMHAMQPEPARTPDERPGDPVREAAYNARLKAYLSAGPARFAIEVRGGTIASLGLRVGDTVELDAQRLQSPAR